MGLFDRAFGQFDVILLNKWFAIKSFQINPKCCQSIYY